MSKRRKNAGEGYGYMFHGAFSEKKDAVAKERKTKGAWVRGTMTKNGWRYLVMSPRTNPIKRKRKPRENSIAWGQQKISLKEFRKLLREHGYGPEAAVRGATREQAMEMIRRLDENHGKHAGQNPSELIVLGANPHESYSPREIQAKPGETITIRINPEPSMRAGDDSQYMHMALLELYPGRSFSSLTASELSQVAQLAARLKHARRPNLYLGFGPSHPSKKELASSRRRFKENVRAKTKEEREYLRALRKSARRTRGQAKLDRLFHEVYGPADNPRRICGARIGRYKCTRDPGHLGPHLPQGATLRPRSRHNWDPRDNPSAEALRESFVGREVDRVSIYREPHMPEGNYALIGKLLALYVKPLSGGQVQMIKPTGAIVVSDESARQLYFVGGDQDVTDALEIFGARDRGNGVYELGEARRIDYKQRKEHVPQPEIDEWRHDLGEENGIRPRVLFDAKHKRLMFEGGDYVVRTEGIVN